MARPTWSMIWAPALAALLLGFCALSLSDVAVAAGSTSGFFCGLMLLGLLLTPIAARETGGWLCNMAASVAGAGLFFTICAGATFCSYAAAIYTHGYVDDLAAAADRLLGFDWRAAHAWEVSHPALIPYARGIYGSIGWTVLLLVVALPAAGHGDHLRRFLAVYATSLGITVALFVLFPLKSAVLHFMGPKPDYMPYVGLAQATTIDALRNGTLHTITYGNLAGLIGFPSFHTVSGLLFIWASQPLRLLRWPVLIVNVLMIAVTPVEGAHYLVDILGGIAVAFAAMALFSPAQSRLPVRSRSIGLAAVGAATA